MADIKNIAFGSTIPDKRLIVHNNELIEIKRSYKIHNNQAVIVWDVSDDYNFMYVMSATESENIFLPQISNSTYSVMGKIDWGDGITEDYQTDAEQNHIYDKSGIYNIKIMLDEYDTDKYFYIPDSFFRQNLNLLEIHIKTYFYSISDNAFDECTNLKIADLSGVYHISEYAFSECYNLEQIILNSAYEIGEWGVSSYSFSKCENIKEIIFPSTLKTIAPNTFQDCTSLCKVHFLYTPNDFQRVGAQAFANCTNLSEVIIESDLRVIFERCFEGCTALSAISLPSSIIQIQSNAFYNVNKAFDIHYNGTIDDWNNITKQSNWNNTCGEIAVHCINGDIIIPAFKEGNT